MDYQKQALQFLEDTKTSFKVEYLDHARYFPDDKECRDIYLVKLRRNGKSYSFKFGQPIANTGSEPSAYDVLACITKNDPGTFENFCGEYGYDIDSRKAEKIYKAVCKEYKSIDRLFNDVMDQLQEIN